MFVHEILREFAYLVSSIQAASEGDQPVALKKLIRATGWSPSLARIAY